MTTEEYKAQLGVLEEKHYQEIRHLKVVFAKSRLNKQYPHGAIVCANSDFIIEIDFVKLDIDEYALPALMYCGYLFTKAGVRRKDNTRHVVYARDCIEVTP